MLIKNSKCIDNGLIDSNFGIVVISHSFLKKDCTDYELRSLINKEIGGKKVILPIWYNITKEEVKRYSLFLADKLALTSDLSPNILINKLIQIIRPDIVNSHLLIRASRNFIGEIKDIPLSKIDLSTEKVHKELPVHLIMATQLISTIFSDTSYTNFRSMIDGFARDWDYTREFSIWMAFACTYIDFLHNYSFSISDKAIKKTVLSFLLGNSLSIDTSREALSLLSSEQLQWISSSYNNYLEFFSQFVNL